MKKIRLIALFCALGFFASAQVQNSGTYLKINPGLSLKANFDVINKNEGNIINEGSIATTNNFSNETDGVVEGAGTYLVTENWTNSATFTANNSTVELTGPTTSMVTSGGSPFATLKINKDDGADIDLLDDASIASALDFASDNNKVNIDANDLILQETATITGYDNNDYIVTGSTGFVTKELLAGSFEFPVGFDNATYNPFTADRSGVPDELHVRCLENVLKNGTSGAVETEKLIDVSWQVTGGNLGDSNLDFTAQWELSDELTGFDRASSALFKYDTEWSNGIFDAAAGAGPYTQSDGGYTSLSIFTVGSAGALPLELLSFEGTALTNANLLEWKTASESNISHFEVERSATAVDFSYIGSVAARGNTTETTSYDFRDLDLTPSMYYRLKIVGERGDVDYSSVIHITREQKPKGTYTVFPNPANNMIQLSIATTENATLQVRLIDNLGRTVQQHTVDSNASGELNFQMEIESLPMGVYFVQVLEEEQINTVSFVKTN